MIPALRIEVVEQHRKRRRVWEAERYDGKNEFLSIFGGFRAIHVGDRGQMRAVRSENEGVDGIEAYARGGF